MNAKQHLRYPLAVAIAMLLLPVLGTAQTSSVNQPDLKVGDHWKIERRDALTKAVLFSEETTITSVSPSKIEASINAATASMTPDLTILDSPRFSYDSGYQFLRFPLEIGKEWEFKTKWRNNQNGTSGRTQFDVAVKAVESVKISAGEFDAYKLEAGGWMNFDAGGSRRVSVTYWYSPKAKAIIRMTWVDRRDDFVSELVDLSLVP